MTPTEARPNPAPWEIDPASVAEFRRQSARPLLFTGVYLAGHDGAYVWGSRSHANPVCSNITKTSVTNSIMGQTVVLFVDGHVRIVDFTKENPAPADPERWWVPASNY